MGEKCRINKRQSKQTRNPQSSLVALQAKKPLIGIAYSYPAT